MRRDVFQALADPTRRAILTLLAAQALTVGQVAERFAVSRPAVSKHVKILEECGLVRIRDQGRERLCEADLGGLQEVAEWLEQHRRFWAGKLDALEQFLDSQNPPFSPNLLT